MDIYSAHVLISITCAVFEYLDTALATENKILRFSRAVLPYKTRSSNVNLALISYFHVTESNMKKGGRGNREYSPAEKSLVNQLSNE